MANKIEPVTNLRPIDGFVDGSSRYVNSTILRYGNANRLTFNTYKRQPSPFQPTDQVMIIGPGLEFRPDLVSRKVYGTPNFWWRIMEANKIFDIFDFTSGKTIRIPRNIIG